jgi:hypothetical protein
VVVLNREDTLQLIGVIAYPFNSKRRQEVCGKEMGESEGVYIFYLIGT